MSSVLAFLRACVQDGLTPGAAALVRTRDGTRAVHCAGTLHTQPRAREVGVDTIYDLASLTKLLCTTVVCARAVDAGVLDLEEQPWSRWRGVTVAHVLQHRAGLPDWLPLHKLAEAFGPIGLPTAGKRIVDLVTETAPLAPAGTVTLYSDLGFIALGALVEQRLGAPLDVLMAPSPLRFVRVYDEGMHAALLRVAPTERCPWRNHTVIGQVHDENCFAMGGVSGHAGLFGSLLDVETAAWPLVEAVQGAGTLAAWAQHGGERGLGFDKATLGGSTGDVLGPRAVGHLGFTGVSVWIDPDLHGGALFVLLTNHVHFGRDKARIRGVRQGFHRAAVTSLLASPLA